MNGNFFTQMPIERLGKDMLFQAAITEQNLLDKIKNKKVYQVTMYIHMRALNESGKMYDAVTR